MTVEFDSTKFFSTFGRVRGFMHRAQVKQRGRPAVIVNVKYEEPHSTRFGVARSVDYTIEYQASDLPLLAQNDSVIMLDDDDQPIPKQKFIVREPPFVTEDPARGTDGTWKFAVLTQVTA